MDFEWEHLNKDDLSAEDIFSQLRSPLPILKKDDGNMDSEDDIVVQENVFKISEIVPEKTENEEEELILEIPAVLSLEQPTYNDNIEGKLNI